MCCVSACHHPQMASLECILEGAKKYRSQRVVYGDYREDEGVQFIPHFCDCLHCVLIGVWWCCYTGGGHDLCSCSSEPLQFISFNFFSV